MTAHIHGVDFEVNLVHAHLSTLNMGESQWDKCLIQIMDDLPLERQQQVCIHEFVHVLLDGEEDRDAVDEGFVRRLGNSLWALLNDNDLLAPDWWERVLERPQDNIVPLKGHGKA